MSVVALSKNRPRHAVVVVSAPRSPPPSAVDFWNTMETMKLAVGHKVQVINSDRVEKLHEYNRLVYSKQEHSMWLGKVGVVSAVDGEAITVKMFEWANHIQEGGGKKLLEVDNVFHCRALRPISRLVFCNGDRPVLQQNDTNGKAEYHHVSLRIIDAGIGSEPVYSLRTTKMHTFHWKQSERASDILLPVYVGRTRAHVMRERSSALADIATDSSAARIVCGQLSGDDGRQLMIALQQWNRDDGAQFRMAAQRYPEQVNLAVSSRTCIMMAVDYGNWPAAVCLIAMGAQRECMDDNGNTLLHIAAAKGHTRILEGLLTFIEKEINRANLDGDTPLHLAARGMHAASLDRLLGTPLIQTNIQNNLGESVMHVICSLPDAAAGVSMLGRLLGSPRANPAIPNTEGLTPLEIAILKDSGKCVELLLASRPALLVSESRLGLSPLHQAVVHGKAKIVEIIIQCKQDQPLEQKLTPQGRSALHLAVEKWQGAADKAVDKLAIIQTLVTGGVPLNAADSDGQTATHLLIRQMNKSAVKADRRILHSMINCNRASMRLDEMAAKLRPHWLLTCVCYLSSKGADLTIRDRSGLSPIECCDDSLLQDSLRELSNQRPRSCLPMTTANSEFDSSEVHMCTFNCEDSVADVQFQPCGHRVACKECALKTTLRRCPMCCVTIASAIASDGSSVEMGSALRAVAVAEDQTKLDLEKAKKSEEAARQAKIDAETERQKEIQDLRDKLNQLEMETSCTICIDARPSVVFNCGHTACHACAVKLKLCHFCREPITKTQTIYA